jgi:stage II sporulation protein AA (anti-sigma F factor antagonist)
MSVQTERDGKIAIVRLIDRIDSSNAAEAEQAVREVLEAREAGLLLDLSELDYISSAGLRVVLVGAKGMRANGGRFAMSGMKPNIRQVFEISGFLSMLQVHDDRSTALQALAS